MDIVSTKAVAKHVRSLRIAAGFSQDGLARAAGIPHSTYLKIEQGTTPNPSIQTVLHIAEALDVSLDMLVGRA